MTDAEVVRMMGRIETRFDRLEARVEARGNGLEMQMSAMNNKVTDAHVLLAEHGVTIENHAELLQKSADALHKLSNIVQKKLTPRDVTLIVTAIVGTVTVLQFFGFIHVAIPKP